MMTRTAGTWLTLSLLLACSPETTGHLAVRASALDPEVVIDASVEHQHITGFGASSAWTSPNLSASLSDQIFSPETGIGLSLLRLHVNPDGTTDEVGTALAAQQRGARVWAAPWSPPGEWKTSGTAENGGSLMPEHYQDWASRLADFVESAEEAGIDLFALSAQNEPDWVAIWETCEWTPEDLATFIGDYLGPTLAERGLSTKLIGPESANWDSFPSYGDAIFANEAAKSAVDVIAVHSYGGTAFAYTKPAEHDKEFWETEVSESGPLDDGMGSAMRMVQMVHQHLTVAKVNAWHFWWIQPNGGVSSYNDSLFNNGALTRRGYALGNFARFVRPGAMRIDATPATSGSVKVTAYRNADAGSLAIVAINSASTAQPIQFRLQGFDVEWASVTPWVTSEEAALEAQAPVAVTDQSFAYALPAFAVTTLVGSTEPVGSGSGGSDGVGGSNEGGAANGGEAGSEAPAGSGGSSGKGGTGSGAGATAGTSSAGAPTTGGSDNCCSVPELPQTPSVACLCRTPGGAPGSEGGSALLSVSFLFGLFALRKTQRRPRA